MKRADQIYGLHLRYLRCTDSGQWVFLYKINLVFGASRRILPIISPSNTYSLTGPIVLVSERRYRMKNKIVIEVQMHCDKSRSKAMQIAASTDRVESVALEGDEKKRLVVTGDGVDSVNLTKTLRKKIGRADIVEQGEVKKKEKEKEEKVEESNYKIQGRPRQPVIFYDLESNPNRGACSIL